MFIDDVPAFFDIADEFAWIESLARKDIKVKFVRVGEGVNGDVRKVNNGKAGDSRVLGHADDRYRPFENIHLKNPRNIFDGFFDKRNLLQFLLVATKRVYYDMESSRRRAFHRAKTVSVIYGASIAVFVGNARGEGCGDNFRRK